MPILANDVERVLADIDTDHAISLTSFCNMACSLSSVPLASFPRWRGGSTPGPSHHRTLADMRFRSECERRSNNGRPARCRRSLPNWRVTQGLPRLPLGPSSFGVADMDRVTIPLLRTPPQSTVRISIDADIHFTFRRTSRIGPLTDVSAVPTEYDCEWWLWSLKTM